MYIQTFPERILGLQTTISNSGGRRRGISSSSPESQKHKPPDAQAEPQEQVTRATPSHTRGGPQLTRHTPAPARPPQPGGASPWLLTHASSRAAPAQLQCPQHVVPLGGRTDQVTQIPAAGRGNRGRSGAACPASSSPCRHSGSRAAGSSLAPPAPPLHAAPCSAWYLSGGS